MDTLTDIDTVDEIAAAFRSVYRQALEIAAPRIWARFNALVAADSVQQTISDDEWADIVETADDPVGDAVLDGAMAGVVTLGALGSTAVLAKRILEHITSLTKYGPNLRANIDNWIATTIADAPPETLEELLRMLEDDSPLSSDKADLVARTETQPAVNAGLHANLDASPPAAVRWVTQRDLRVRFYHAVADTDTIPYGEEFSIGGYPARYPGDPQLPFDLRVNCRCELAYVEGDEVRRAIGASKSELRAKANELDITGRSKMNKGQLQFAVLKALCQHGLAGGPDCPDKLDQMNRTALLTLARGQGIVGRHRMSRQDLLASLRDSLRGTDPGRIASGFAPRQEFSRAVKSATTKRRLLPDQAGSGKIPPLTARRSARRAVFDEADDGKGYAVCVHCGLRIHWDPTQGFALLVPEPIVPWSEGGTMDLSNLLPSCPSCFRARGGRGLTASAADTTPRDYHGRWTKAGGGAVGPVHAGWDESAGRDSVEVITAKMKQDVVDAKAVEDDWIAGKHPGYPVASTYVWRRDRGYKPESELDKDFEAATGDRSGWSPAKKAAATQRLNRKAVAIAEREAVGTTPPTPDHVAVVRGAVAFEGGNPKMQAAVARYGEVPVVASQTIPGGNAGNYAGFAINIAHDPFVQPAIRGPLQASRINVDTSTGGVLRHEYGHHVHSRMELQHPEEHAEFGRRYRLWNDWDITPDDANEYLSREPRGLSTYGQTNVGEAFAETFAMVTHPDYDRSKITDENLGAMADIVERLISG